jgi:hypothetical protein
VIYLWGIDIYNRNGCMRRSVEKRDLDATIITYFRCWGKVPTKFCGVYDGDGVWCDGGTVSVSGETFDENG